MSSLTNKLPVAIAGGGIIGLLLALSLKEQVGIDPVVYEAKEGVCSDTGSGLIIYPNGLRVLRDSNKVLLMQIRDAGHVFRDQRWERHDGTEIMAAHDTVLSHDDDELASIGIRHDILQKILYDAVVAAGIKVIFNKSITSVLTVDEDTIQIYFADGTNTLTQVLFGADGVRSTVREQMWRDAVDAPKYSGVTVVMGLAPSPQDQKDLCFPSCKGKSHCHAVYFPTASNEQCFQLYFHDENEINVEKNCPWENHKMAPDDCKKVAHVLQEDGWHERYWRPVENATHGLKISFRTLSKPLSSWVNGRVALVGDAAHPPVPYLGQGVQMGFEDVGVLSTLIKMFCRHDEDSSNTLDLSQWDKCMTLYQEIRMKRAAAIIQASRSFGELEDRRTEETDESSEMMIRGDVLINGTISMLEESADHDYMDDVRAATSRKMENIDPALCLQALEELMGMSESDILMSPTSRILGWNRKPRVSRQQAKEALDALEGLMG